MITKVQLIEDIDKVWHYSSMKVQYVVAIVLGVWITMSQDQQTAVLTALGIPGDKLALIGGLLWLLANVTARITTVTSNAPAAGK